MRGGFENPLTTSATLADGAVTSIKLASTLQSDNYVAGVTGWQIRRDTGDAEFQDITARGTIEATAGDIGSLTISGSLRMLAGADILFTRNSSAKISTNHNPQNGDTWIEYRGNNAGAIIGLFKSGGVELVTAQMNVTNDGFEINQGQFLLENFNTAAIPDLAFGLDKDTGLRRVTTNEVALVAGGADRLRASQGFVEARITGAFDVYIGGSLNTRVGNSLAIVTPLTTGAAADLRVGSANLTDIRRVTSAAKYKSRINKKVDYLADIRLVPTKHYRKDDKRWRYSLIADWLAEQDPLLGEFNDDGEVANYDTGAVLAVMAAKIKRLEDAQAA